MAWAMLLRLMPTMANTTLDVTFMGTFDPVGGSTPPVAYPQWNGC